MGLGAEELAVGFRVRERCPWGEWQVVVRVVWLGIVFAGACSAVVSVVALILGLMGACSVAVRVV